MQFLQTTQRPRHAKMDGRFRKIYSRAFDPPRFFPWARLDNYLWTGFRWKPSYYPPPSSSSGWKHGWGSREKLGNMPRANIIGRHPLTGEPLTTKRRWCTSPTLVRSRATFRDLHRAPVRVISPKNRFLPPAPASHPSVPPLRLSVLGEIYCTPLFATGP